LKTNRNLFQLCLLGSLLLGKIHYIKSKATLKYAGNIVSKLKTDTLPKITAQHSADLQTALDSYKQTRWRNRASSAMPPPCAINWRRWWKASPCAAARYNIPPTANIPTLIPPTPD